MLSYGHRDDVMSTKTYSNHQNYNNKNIDRGSSQGWLGNTGSASTVGNQLGGATAHRKQTTSPMMLVTPYSNSQSNLTEYPNLNTTMNNNYGASKAQSGQFTTPTQMSSNSPLHPQSHTLDRSPNNIGIKSASSISQLPPDQQLHAAHMLIAKKDQVI